MSSGSGSYTLVWNLTSYDDIESGGQTEKNRTCSNVR